MARRSGKCLTPVDPPARCKETLVKTSLATRIAALLAAAFMTVLTIESIAHYALPSLGTALMAAADARQ